GRRLTDRLRIRFATNRRKAPRQRLFPELGPPRAGKHGQVAARCEGPERNSRSPDIPFLTGAASQRCWLSPPERGRKRPDLQMTGSYRGNLRSPDTTSSRNCRSVCEREYLLFSTRRERAWAAKEVRQPC